MMLAKEMTQMNTRTFGAFLAQCMHDKGLTQAQPAEQLHVKDKAVSRRERRGVRITLCPRLTARACAA